MVTPVILVKEKSTAKYTAIIKDENDNVIPSSDLTALTLTLYNNDDPDRPVINSRNAQNVLNANNVTVDSVGALAWELQPLDNVITDRDPEFENHIALFQFEWDSGNRKSSHRIVVRVERINELS